MDFERYNSDPVSTFSPLLDLYSSILILLMDKASSGFFIILASSSVKGIDDPVGVN